MVNKVTKLINQITWWTKSYHFWKMIHKTKEEKMWLKENPLGSNSTCTWELNHFQKYSKKLYIFQHITVNPDMSQSFHKEVRAGAAEKYLHKYDNNEKATSVQGTGHYHRLLNTKEAFSTFRLLVSIKNLGIWGGKMDWTIRIKKWQSFLRWISLVTIL